MFQNVSNFAISWLWLSFKQYVLVKYRGNYWRTFCSMIEGLATITCFKIWIFLAVLKSILGFHSESLVGDWQFWWRKMERFRADWWLADWKSLYSLPFGESRWWRTDMVIVIVYIPSNEYVPATSIAFINDWFKFSTAIAFQRSNFFRRHHFYNLAFHSERCQNWNLSQIWAPINGEMEKDCIGSIERRLILHISHLTHHFAFMEAKYAQNTLV